MDPGVVCSASRPTGYPVLLPTIGKVAEGWPKRLLRASPNLEDVCGAVAAVPFRVPSDRSGFAVQYLE